MVPQRQSKTSMLMKLLSFVIKRLQYWNMATVFGDCSTIFSYCA